MEIKGSDGSKILLRQGSQMEFGRGSGFKFDDRTVSRRHVSFQLRPLDRTRLHFKVVGKNPIWVRSSRSGEVNTFRTPESGEMETGDVFCVSAKNPIWFAIRKTEFESAEEINARMELGSENELAESLEISSELKDIDAIEPESVDISHIDPVKEFGFVAMGHEFDSYPKKVIRNIKNWDWFIEEPGPESEDDEFEQKKRKKGGKRKRKKGEENDDEEWSMESEEEKEQIANTKRFERPKYLTRSRDRNKPCKDTTGKGGRSTQKKNKRVDEDEDDETLGGFIVDNDELEQEEDIDEEEEEFDEQDDEEELGD